MITCHISSLPERSDCLKRTINSIYNQVDKIYVGLNGYTLPPRWLQDLQKVKWEILNNSLGDGAKWLHCWDEPSLCVVVDDDLILPNSFVETLRRGHIMYGGAVSFHGRKYDVRPIVRFRRSFTANYRCLGTVMSDVQVHLIGTGCLLFDNTQIKFNQSLYEHKNMADVLFSRLCTQQGIPMTVLSHAKGYIQYMPQKTTIWNTTGDDGIQTRIINEFLK